MEIKEPSLIKETWRAGNLIMLEALLSSPIGDEIYLDCVKIYLDLLCFELNQFIFYDLNQI